LHLNENAIDTLDISVLFHFESLESLTIDDRTLLLADHKLKHLPYFPNPINDMLDNIEWIHEPLSQKVEND
ncbi:MAG: hypothetical protein ACFFEM_15090, partial [Candidatus Thorarchaeota archaeon]